VERHGLAGCSIRDAPEDAYRVAISPGQTSILDGWSTFDPQGPLAFLYPAFVRATAGGTTYAAFELNHDSRLWNNGKASIPCRSTGDVLVSYQAQGNAVGVTLQRWTTSSTDLATGCARTGTLDDFNGFEPNVDAQAAVNEDAIPNHLPGSYAASIPVQRFGEASLNLVTLLGKGFDDPCFSFGSFWIHSRSSTSETANLQDYVAPGRL
jgi:hypothetical protein